MKTNKHVQANLAPIGTRGTGHSIDIYFLSVQAFSSINKHEKEVDSVVLLGGNEERTKRSGHPKPLKL